MMMMTTMMIRTAPDNIGMYKAVITQNDGYSQCKSKHHHHHHHYLLLFLLSFCALLFVLLILHLFRLVLIFHIVIDHHHYLPPFCNISSASDESGTGDDGNADNDNAVTDWQDTPSVGRTSSDWCWSGSRTNSVWSVAVRWRWRERLSRVRQQRRSIWTSWRPVCDNVTAAQSPRICNTSSSSRSSSVVTKFHPGSTHAMRWQWWHTK